MISKKLETIELKKVNEVQAVPQITLSCNICEDQGHSTNDCPTIPAFKEVLLDQSSAVNMVAKSFSGPYSNTYNSGWRNHPNFSWRGEQAALPAPNIAGPSQFAPYTTPGGSGPSQYANHMVPAQKKNLEDNFQQLSTNFQQLSTNFQQFMQSQAAINSQNSQVIAEIRGSVTRLTTTMSAQEKGKFPAQSQPNPQGQNHQFQNVTGDSNVKQVKAITTLRSGKVIGVPAQEVEKNGNTSKPPSENEAHDPLKSESVPSTTLAPFPQRLAPLHKDKHHAEILEIFKQVRINIPLLDAIQQIPTYAKFLKDLCTVKRKLNVQKKAFLTEQVSAIIQTNTPPKYKDPGSPTIACMIGSSKIGQALLDLGSSVNLLPYNVYVQLGLGELKPTSITLQLADRSIKIPRGVVEDVLVQVDKFYYPVDFVVLDMQLTNHSTFQAPVILGRPFLATSNALINCRSGVLKLSFENMTLELNIFNLCRQPQEVEEVHEVNLLENFIDENSSHYFQLIDSLEEFEEDLKIFDNVNDSTFVSSIGQQVTPPWRPKFEQLPPLTSTLKPSEEQSPTLDFKPLPLELKYAFLGPQSTFPVVISSHLTSEQEDKLLEVLKKHKKSIG
ncbi:hypothetical protein I3842_03G122900 [Carya illinoinensis]|uniref:Retrotransposon gag protein n=1 Tax=Carya illinoinensis TaxID=32201 RepID=A0A922FF94_CARIL|nr:hypothetical protein I3842_03G122900 [Carya illinoinensis]